ncbi:MAG TPA: PEP-CTERM sorting domain-containing protein [Steroidobacteraceae bacterium]|nr:PEP-CTERM sorting domain-containing protein [Steroidobacteraceae bacterium]
MGFKKFMAAAALLAVVTPFAAQANTEVATISGCYDCLSFDTPGLVINNTTGGTLDNAKMVLTGYQGDNNGVTATVDLGNLGTSTTLVWGSLPNVSGALTPFSLTSGDYDDQFINTSEWIPNTNCESAGNPNTSGCVSGGGPGWYAKVGNFTVTFTATVSGGQFDGQSVFAVFSPASNATGGFVSWEGLNAEGFSEDPCCDVHHGGLTGDLANIFLGTPPPPPTPEPDSLGLAALGVGLVALAIRRRHRSRHPSA